MWVYRKKVVIDGYYDIGHEACAERVCSDLVNLWLLADLLKDQDCENAVMDAIVILLKKYTSLKGRLLFSPGLTITIWSATTAGSALRRVALDYTLACADRDLVEAQRDGFHPGFIRDILSMTTSEPQLDRALEQSSADSAKALPCFYHVHARELISLFCRPLKFWPAQDTHRTE